MNIVVNYYPQRNIPPLLLIKREIDKLEQVECNGCNNCCAVSFVGYTTGCKVYYDIYHCDKQHYILKTDCKNDCTSEVKIIKNLTLSELYEILGFLPNQCTITNIKFVPSTSKKCDCDSKKCECDDEIIITPPNNVEPSEKKKCNCRRKK